MASAKTERKSPWLKFYPTDWRADPKLRMCSIAARGLWMEVICLMWESSQRGHLLVNDRAVTPKQLASLAGISLKECSALLAELQEAAVYSVSEDGAIYSRRMVRDIEKAERDRNNGKGGGNPNLIPQVNGGVNPQDDEGDKGEDKAHSTRTSAYHIPEARLDSSTSTVDTSVSTSEVPPAQPAAALPEEQSDEDLFWSLAKECEAKGITRSRLGKLMKLAHAGATTMPAATRLVQSCLKAKDPSTYFGATIRELEDEAGVTRAKQITQAKNGKKVPPWVSEWREAGETVTPIGPNQWASRGKTYDDEGRLTGW
ncbi:hypothetical protein AB4037_08660 [Labrys sp. KB_33_2]|uniref:hypothetical protein n=1 Tax=Labrys sp. KB_33_2 TaxID=3237479 RepID=UPI003F939368